MKGGFSASRAAVLVWVVASGCGVRSDPLDPSDALLCDFFDGNVSGSGRGTSPPDCGAFEDDWAALDSDLGSAARARTPAGCHQSVSARKTVAMGSTRSAGSRAGAFITRSANIDANMIAVYATLQGNVVQTATGPTLDFAAADGLGSGDEYVFLTTTQAFDGLEIEVTVSDPSSAASLKIYELCSEGGVRSDR